MLTVLCLHVMLSKLGKSDCPTAVTTHHGTAGALGPRRKSAVACLAALILQARASPAAAQSAATLRAQGTRHFLSSHACSRYNTFILQTGSRLSSSSSPSPAACLPICLSVCQPASNCYLHFCYTIYIPLVIYIISHYQQTSL
jgi:hypothetical protein